MMAAGTDLYSPAAYVDGPPHAALEELRRTSPVYWQDIPGQPGYWAVLKHADVVHVSREPLLFSASEGGIMLEDAPPAQLERMRNMLLAMDPPRHGEYRRPLAPRFKAKVIAGLEDRVREICRSIFERVGEGDVEFGHDGTSGLPSQVVGELVGIPEEDWPKIHRWSEMSTSSQDPDFQHAGGEVMDPALAMAMAGSIPTSTPVLSDPSGSEPPNPNPNETVPVRSARIAGSFGLRASNRSATRGRPPVISRVFDDSCGIRASTSPTPTSAPSSRFTIAPEGR